VTTTRPRELTVLFDLDGTILDSFEGLSRSYAHAVTSLGLPEPTLDALRPCIGPPLRENFARLLATTDRERIEHAVAFFRGRYDAIGWKESRLYDGALDMLDAVARTAARVLVLTAKPQKFTDRIVAHFGLDRVIAGAYGPTLDGTLDDKRVLLAHVIEKTGLDPTRAAVVGDRHTDMAAAVTHGALPVGVTWGYGSAEELLGAGAKFLCATPPDVVKRLLDLGA
jgi:phosphoglycolate phosphatase